ncbi:hypothetical protein WKI71_43805 [Streptomyces sp. MS1.AVA.1]|uniref:Uncharacterized protein n=1 Tax=Streptomyces machairae TaxID=3134109 RepID=A0ABU8UV43_9ACTN
MRRELAAILDNRASIDLPADFKALADDLPEAQRSLLLAYSSFLTPAAMSALKEQLSAPRSDVGAQFESLPADAPDDVRRQLAVRLAPEARKQQRDHPFLGDLEASSAGKGRSPSRLSCRRWSSSTTRLSSTSCDACTNCFRRTTPPGMSVA